MVKLLTPPHPIERFMKKLCFLLITFLLILNLNCKGQVLDELIGIRFKNGFIVLNTGDTLKGSLFINNSDYRYIGFKNPVNNKRKVYDGYEVKCFYADSLFFYPKLLGDYRIFMGLLLNDSLKIYYFHCKISTMSDEAFIYEKPDGQSIVVRPLSFKKRVGDFFNDYPELSKKIHNKTYRMKDLFLIAYEYNKWLRQKKSKE